MDRKKILMVITGLLTLLIITMPVLAQGPGKSFYNPAAENYHGPDYGAGSTPTATVNGYWVDVIPNANIQAIGHYFSEWWEPFTDKCWVYYKFWLTEPVKIICPNGEEYYATKFITIKAIMSTGDYILLNYK